MRRSSTSTPRTSSTSPPSSSKADWSLPLAHGRVAHVRHTRRSDGDQTPRQASVDLPSTWLRQVHGAAVVQVRRPGEANGATADASVTDAPGAALAVRVADCAPLALVSPEGVVGAVHAGWRGLEAGVVTAAADAMRALGARTLGAVLGPCIRVDCYEFGRDDLERLAARWGPDVAGATRSGAPAFDLTAAVRIELDRAGVALEHDVGVCTACSPDHFSHRARGDEARQAMVVWMD